MSAVEAIVAKYLSPSQSTASKPTKRVIKRPYGVSVTDLDVVGEKIIKEQKKKVQKRVKKRAPGDDDDDDELLKTKSKKAKSLSKSSETPSTINCSPVVHATIDYPSQSSRFHPNDLHFPASVSLPNPPYQFYSSQPTSHGAHQFQDLSTSTSPTCGRCYQRFHTLHIGGYCAQCRVSMCWPCV